MTPCCLSAAEGTSMAVGHFSFHNLRTRHSWWQESHLTWAKIIQCFNHCHPLINTTFFIVTTVKTSNSSIWHLVENKACYVSKCSISPVVCFLQCLMVCSIHFFFFFYNFDICLLFTYMLLMCCSFYVISCVFIIYVHFPVLFHWLGVSHIVVGVLSPFTSYLTGVMFI
jgi:hypothetical protein